jgi:micrococcal nuclease
MTPLVFVAVLVSVIDGDTIKVDVPAWSATPFHEINVRIAGIDAPESKRGQAKCEGELQRGLAARRYARTLIAPGAQVTGTIRGHDKYGRVLADITLPDGRGFATAMTSAGYARPYDGKRKGSWCK